LLCRRLTEIWKLIMGAMGFNMRQSEDRTLFRNGKLVGKGKIRDGQGPWADAADINISFGRKGVPNRAREATGGGRKRISEVSSCKRNFRQES